MKGIRILPPARGRGYGVPEPAGEFLSAQVPVHTTQHIIKCKVNTEQPEQRSTVGELKQRNLGDTSGLSLATRGPWEMECVSMMSQQRPAGGGPLLLFLPRPKLFASWDLAVNSVSLLSLWETTALNPAREFCLLPDFSCIKWEQKQKKKLQLIKIRGCN